MFDFFSRSDSLNVAEIAHLLMKNSIKKPRNPVKCPPFCPIVVVNIMTSAMNFGDVMPLLYSSKGSGNGRVIAHERHKGAP